MKKQIIIPKEIVTVNLSDEILRDHFLEIIDGKISSIKPFISLEADDYDGKIYRAENLTLIPGFVQTHIHLCQTLFRGLADDLELLDWLQLRIFPYENAHDKKSLSASVRLGINELLLSGTTTILDMGTVNNQEVIFEELIETGMRAVAGKCMIDRNELFDNFKETTEDSLKSSYDYAKSFHHSNNGRLKYGFAPRFVLSCTQNLLKKAKEMMGDFDGSIYHTHSSENKHEVEEVRKLHGKENIEYFDSIGVLDSCTVLAHCIHVNDDEIKTLKSSRASVSHCPSSNLKLGSGIADIPRYLKENINVSLGADGAPCNNSLSIFNEMRLASFIQKPLYHSTIMDAKTVFKMGTIEGAKALNMINEIGSIEVGKKADMVLLDLTKSNQSLLENDVNIYSNIVYSASRENVKDVMIEGEWKVRDGKSVIFEDDQLVDTGKSELQKLLNRV